MTTHYSVETEAGNIIADGIASIHEAARLAQAHADDNGVTVGLCYYRDSEDEPFRVVDYTPGRRDSDEF